MIKSAHLCTFLILLCLSSAYSPLSASNSSIFTSKEAHFQDSTKRANLLKQLSEAIKFRKKAITKEQARVQDIIEKVIGRDTTKATTQDLEQLKADLSESSKEQFDTLLELIKQIRIPESESVVTVEAEAGGDPSKVPFKVKKELDPNDKYINDLVDRLIPILTDTKEQEEEVSARHENLSTMRKVFAGQNTVIDTLNDSLAVKYRLRLKNKAEVIGIHKFDAKYRSSKFNLSTLSTLAYNSYELDGSTGYAKNFNQWNDALIITEAKEAGLKVLLTVTTSSSLEMAKFLTNETAQRTMISTTLDLLEKRGADGINIAVSGLNQRLRMHFVQFLKNLSDAYSAKNRKYAIVVTLPVYDQLRAFDIPALDSYVDQFIIDFSKKPTGFPGPIAPLNDDSDYSIQSSVSRYLNMGVPPYKFILGLSYYGVQFKLDPISERESFQAYIPYKQIRLNYQYAPVTHNQEQASVSIETRDDEGNLTGHIYYDNDITLEQKYDFVLENGLGGVAIWEMGADDGYGELWDALASKFLTIDTVSAQRIALKASKPTDGSLWSYIKTNSIAYFYALQYPCDQRYDHPETLMLTVINIVLALLAVALAVYLILRIKVKGEKWKWKKTVFRILIVTINLFIITIFMWLYIDNSIPWFGAGEDCISMPFIVLLLVIFTGILLGSLLMRFLIFPAIQHDERP